MSKITAIDIAEDLYHGQDPEWVAASESDDLEAPDRVIAAWAERLNAAAERLGIELTILSGGWGSPEAAEWSREHSDLSTETVSNLTADVWTEAMRAKAAES